MAAAVGRTGAGLHGAAERRRIRVAAQRAAMANQSRRVDHRRRLLVLLAVLASLFAILASKVVDLQVLNPSRYVAFGTAQRTNTQVLAAERGSILDRNGAEMAISKPARSVFVDPGLIEDPVVEAAAVAPLLGLDVDQVRAEMTGSGRFTYLARKVPVEVADQVAALNLAGVSFIDESERYLPAGDSARSLLGTVDVDNQGITGLEEQFGSQLTGTPGQLSLETNPDGATIAVGDHSLTPAVKGDDLVLTVDRSIQYEAERVLADQVKVSGAKGGTAIITKPSTGEVLAMANVVTDPKTGEVVVGTNNAALTTQYEPGSVMKLVAVSGALEEGEVTPGTSMYLPPVLPVYDAVFGEAEPRGAVTWDVSQILQHSSNVGTIKIAQTLGEDRLHRYQQAFGFGRTTDLDFPNEAAGAVLDPSKYSGTSLPSIAIGQGISVTPMQMLMAYNVIANRGVYVPPKLVQATVDADGGYHPTQVGGTHRVVSETTADELNVMLRSVIADGTGQLAAIDGYDPAGKTGTARKPQPGGGYTDAAGGYHYQSTFVGFVPAEQPALSIYVMIDEPSGGAYTGGTTAAPVFSKLGSFALRRLEIAPPATDAARDGATVQGAASSTAAATAGRIVDDGRVQAPATGSPTTVPTTTPEPGGSTTAITTRRSGTG